jgi:hypothetical protein
MLKRRFCSKAHRLEYKKYLKSFDDDELLTRKFLAKKYNARSRHIDFTLTFTQFCILLRQAKIKSSDLGRSKYHLARKNDTGGYVYGNCSFKPYIENLLEKRISDRSRKASRRNVRKAHVAISKLTAEDLSARIRNGQRTYTKQRQELAKKTRESYESSANKNYLGRRNSQYGSFWITNGIDNKKWKQSKGNFPRGYQRGRSS